MAVQSGLKPYEGIRVPLGAPTRCLAAGEASRGLALRAFRVLGAGSHSERVVHARSWPTAARSGPGSSQGCQGQLPRLQGCSARAVKESGAARQMPQSLIP